MSTASPSPYARPRENVPIVAGAPAPSRPDRSQVEVLEKNLRREAQALLDETLTEQSHLLENGVVGGDLNWLQNRHVLIAGATGQGLGGALAAAVLPRLGPRGTLTAIARDLRYTLGYYSAPALSEKARELGVGERFRLLTRGLAVEGKELDRLVETLRDLGAGDVVYLNMVAAANSGILPGMPPVFVSDVDADGNLFQWELSELNEHQIERTRGIMGEQTTQLPARLVEAGIGVQVEGYAGWRGSHDKISRLPERPEYGRQGSYSTSLWLPKDVLDEHVIREHARGTADRIVQVHFFPLMRTRALEFIPGGRAMAGLFDTLMAAEGIRREGIAELALRMLITIGQGLAGKRRSPFPHYDRHESQLDLWYHQVMVNLSPDEGSAYDYRRWLLNTKTKTKTKTKKGEHHHESRCS